MRVCHCTRTLAHPRHRLRGRGEGLRQLGPQALRRVAQLDLKRHLGASYVQVFERFGRDKIAHGQRVDHGLQRLQQRLGFDSHIAQSK